MLGRLAEHIDKELFLQSLFKEIFDYEQMIIDLFVSNSCNLNCQHCYFLDYRPQDNPLSLKKWGDIIDECIRAGIKHFHFSGKEPFCDSRVPELLDSLNRLARTHSLRYGVVTNGTNITVDELHRIINSNLSYLEFSLEGDANYNYSIRKTDSFNCIYNLVKSLSNTSKINITSTYFGDNLHELANMIDEFRKIGVKKFNIAPFMKYHDNELKPLEELSVQQMIDLVTHFRCYLKVAKNEAIDIRICFTKEQSYEMFLTENSLTPDINHYIYDGERMIYQFGNSILEVNYPLLYIPFLKQMIITTDGFVIPCADDIHYNKLDEISIGSVKEQSLESILSTRKEYISSYVNYNLRTK